MKPAFPDWQALSKWLDRRGLFHMELGLGRMEKALAALGLKTPAFAVCQVLGTNGKGSVSAFLSSLFQASGMKCGLYTSPHFLEPLERIRIDKRNTAREEWVFYANELAAKVPFWEDLTYFEFITTLAMLIFHAENVDIAVLEAGLGGKNDATSAIASGWQCYGPIALDHKSVIGPTIEKIAEDKAAAIRNFSRVFSVPQFPAAEKILQGECVRKKAELFFCRPWEVPPDEKPLLSAPFQAANMGLAVSCANSVWQTLGIRALNIGEINDALCKAFIPGRWQRVAACSSHPPLFLDGGHNPHALQALSENCPVQPCTVIYSCMGDKDWKTGLSMLASAFPNARFLFPQLANPRAESSRKLADWLKLQSSWKKPDKITIFEGNCAVQAALRHAANVSPTGPCLVCGSFFLLAEIFRLFPCYLLAADYLH